jgi:hypothetical protein
MSGRGAYRGFLIGRMQVSGPLCMRPDSHLCVVYFTWGPPRSTAARQEFCLGDAAPPACLPPRGHSPPPSSSPGAASASLQLNRYLFRVHCSHVNYFRYLFGWIGLDYSIRSIHVKRINQSIASSQIKLVCFFYI